MKIGCGPLCAETSNTHLAELRVAGRYKAAGAILEINQRECIFPTTLHPDPNDPLSPSCVSVGLSYMYNISTVYAHRQSASANLS